MLLSKLISQIEKTLDREGLTTDDVEVEVIDIKGFAYDINDNFFSSRRRGCDKLTLYLRASK